MREKYKPYEPTQWEQRLDKAVGMLSTRIAYKRLVNREKAHRFRYLAAQSTSARTNSTATTSGEWMRGSREKMQVMWNAINCVENSGLCSGIVLKFKTYVCGTLRWQSRTGVKSISDQYEQFIRYKTKGSNLDLAGRDSLRQMCMNDIGGLVIKGDIGTNIVRRNDDLFLQGIEADRIGDPYNPIISDRYVRGLILNDDGRIVGVKVYRRDRRSGYYRYDETFKTRDEMGLPKFLFMVNPISYDDKRGVSVFKSAIDNDTYINRMREYELQALLWAASQSGVYHTKSGMLPEQLPFDDPTIVDNSGNQIRTFQVRPNTVTALGETEDVTLFQHDRPSPNVIGMYDNTVGDIAAGTGLTKGFAYNMTGLTGPAVRQCSAQDARAIQIWQELLREQKLDDVIMLLLGDAIARGELPYHPNWMEWGWYFPAKPTIDAGRESAANLSEIEANVNSGAIVAAESGEDIYDIKLQRSHEVEQDIENAMAVGRRVGVPWQEVYSRMIPGKAGAAAVGAAQAGAQADEETNPDKKGATSEGTDVGDDEDKPDGETEFHRNGHRKREEIVIRHEFHDRVSPAIRNEFSAYSGDVAIEDLPSETQDAIQSCTSGGIDPSRKVARYGMTANELIPKADKHNLESAQKNIGKAHTIKSAADSVHSDSTKHILLMNDRVVDGHHHLARALKGKVTKSLPVLDLTPLRFQEPAQK